MNPLKTALPSFFTQQHETYFLVNIFFVVAHAVEEKAAVIALMC